MHGLYEKNAIIPFKIPILEKPHTRSFAPTLLIFKLQQKF